MKMNLFREWNRRDFVARGVAIAAFLIGLSALQGARAEDSMPGTSAPFTGTPVNWHGFDRYDFLMDESDLSIAPFAPPAGEKFGVGAPPAGHRRCVVVVPKNAAPGNPWSWRGCYWDHQPQTEIELLKRGFHIAFITPDPDKTWDAWYDYLVNKHGLSAKPAFIGMSKGGFNEYTWATAHPGKVSCIYADNPAVSRSSLLKLDGLASNDVPLLHVCGSLDPLFGNHTCAVESLYQSLGGRISVMIKEGFGHHPHSLRDPTPIADFIAGSQAPLAATTPDYAGAKLQRSWFFGVKNDYRYFPSEKTHITCRGALFSECCRRYEFGLDGVQGSVTVIAPNTEAPGKPWVYRAGFVERGAAVDVALLEKGYAIVTGPMPYNADGAIKRDWDAVYEHFVTHGFATRPILEGAGGGAGVVYAWAIQNPGKVSCVYAENPALGGAMSVASPADDLAPLAKAGVPLLHVCGSLDPAYGEVTRAVEAKYKELGGKITVVVKEGQAHYPLAPADASAVVELLEKNHL